MKGMTVAGEFTALLGLDHALTFSIILFNLG